MKPESKFAVGEIAIYVHNGSPIYGQEVIIISPLKYRFMGDEVTNSEYYAWAYDIDCNDGAKDWCAEPQDLRKRPLPQDWISLCKLNETPEEVSA